VAFLRAQARQLRAQADVFDAQADAFEAARATSTPSAPSSPAPLLTPHECAAALGVSIATLNRRVNEGAIPYVQIGDARRYDLERVHAALAAAPRVPQLPPVASAPEPQPARGVRRVSAGGNPRPQRPGVRRLSRGSR
jgi:excisionase family DNA binding protein